LVEPEHLVLPQSTSPHQPARRSRVLRPSFAPPLSQTPADAEGRAGPRQFNLYDRRQPPSSEGLLNLLPYKVSLHVESRR
jgi:hypothetical protein